MPTMEEIRAALGKMNKSSEKPLIKTSNNINENVNSNPFSKKLFAPVEQLQSDIQDKDNIIENLKNEMVELKKKVSKVEEEKFTILEELDKSRWLENKVTLATKKVYEDKVKSVINENVDSKIIPILTAVARRKQGNKQLNWGNWLKIPENRYLYELNKDIAKKIFEDTNALIPKKRTRGGGVLAKNYALSFTGNDEHNQSGRNDTARADLVATQFTPNDPTNKGFDEGFGRKPLAESGFTVSYWWKPYENRSDSFPIAWKRDDNGRFEFGISTHTKPYFSIGGSELKSKTWESMFDDSGQGHLSGSLLDNGEGTAPGSGNKLILNKWYHIVATYAGTDNVDGDGNYLRKIYINGYHIYGGFGEAKQSTNWNNYTAAQMTQGLAFGMRTVIASGNHTDGLRNTKYNNGNACALSEVAIYSEEKDASWVSNVYNEKGFNHKNSGGDGLVAYWRFNEGSGDTVKDLGPYGWNGTLTNAGFGTAIDGTTGNSSTIAGINARFPNAKPTWITDTP